MKLRWTSIVVALTFPSVSLGQYYFVPYADWEDMSPAWRSIYLAGTIDALVYAGRPDFVQYSICLSGSGMNSDQLANNLITFVSDKPRLQTRRVQDALSEYLIEACSPSR